MHICGHGCWDEVSSSSLWEVVVVLSSEVCRAVVHTSWWATIIIQCPPSRDSPSYWWWWSTLTCHCETHTWVVEAKKNDITYIPLSAAVTFVIPLASISNLTSSWGTPRGVGGMPESSNLPSSCWRQCTLTLKGLNEHSGLVISCGRKYLIPAHKNDSVASNKFGEDTNNGLDSECKWADIN